MLKRDLMPSLLACAKYYPIVTLMGPRQSGKTTLVRRAFENKPYYNLEAPDIREMILADPRHFFASLSDGAILDEIQRAPELLSYLQVIVDERDVSGQFILTGSHQLELHQAITQSLAGRTAVLTLYPFSIHELSDNHIQLPVDHILLNGLYPVIYRKSLSPTIVYRDYLKTYIERDVRLLLNIKDLVTFQRFIQLSAGRMGNILNTESLANDTGMSHNTLKNWLSILESSYLTYRLMPYFENFGKRIIKSPKLYFTDVGIVSYLLDIHTPTQISHDRLRGALFENLVLMELLKCRANQGKELKIYYYRDSNQKEVDLIIAHRDYLIPIEVKSSATFSRTMTDNLHYFMALAKERVLKSFVIYVGEVEMDYGNISIINYINTFKIIDYIDSLE